MQICMVMIRVKFEKLVKLHMQNGCTEKSFVPECVNSVVSNKRTLRNPKSKLSGPPRGNVTKLTSFARRQLADTPQKKRKMLDTSSFN